MAALNSLSPDVIYKTAAVVIEPLIQGVERNAARGLSAYCTISAHGVIKPECILFSMKS